MAQQEPRTSWRQRLAAQQASGLSVRAWCAQQGIKRTRFYRWRQSLNAAPPSDTPQWATLPLAAPAAPAVRPVPLAAPAAGESGVTLQVGPVTITVTPDFARPVLRDVLAILEAVC